MATTVGTLTINLQAGTAQFDAAMKGVQQSLKSAVVSGSALGTVMGNLFVKLADSAGELAKHMYEFARSVIDTDEQMGKLAQVTGTTTEKFSVLAFGAKLANLSTEELSQSMSFLGKQMALAVSGNADAGALFKSLGVSVKDANGKIRDTGDVLVDITKALAQYRDDANKTEVAQRLFGRSGANLIPYLNSLGTGYEEIAQKARELGVMVGEDTYKQASKFKDALTLLGIQMEGAAGKIINPMLPSLKQFVEDAGKAAAQTVELIGKLQQLGQTKIPVGGQAYQARDVIEALNQVRKQQDEAQFQAIDKFVDLGKKALEPFHLEGYLAAIKAVTGPALSDLEAQVEAVQKAREEAEKNAKKDGDKQDKSQSLKLPPAEKPRDPYEEQISKLKDAIAAQKMLNAVLGESAEAQRVVNATIEANNTNREINNQLIKGQKLTDAQKALINELTQQQDFLKASQEMGKALDEQASGAALAAEQAKNLTLAMTQGDEATRQAAIANEMLALTWGKETGLLAANADALGKVQQAKEDASDEKWRQDQIQAAQAIEQQNQALYDQIDALQLVIPAILQGEEAMRKAAATADRNRVLKQLDTAQTEKQVVAVLKTADATDKVNQLRAQEQDIQAAHQQLDPVGQYNQQIASLQHLAQELTKAQGHALDYSQALAKVAAEHQASIELNQKTIQSLLAVGDAADGAKAFFLQLSDEAKTSAQLMYDVMSQSFDGIADYLSKVMTGTKASFSDFLRSLAQELAKSAITNLFAELLGSLGKKGKGGGAGGLLGGIAGAVGGAVGGPLGAIFGALGGLFGHRQFGGPVSPSMAYIVGERGPEMITGAAGYVHSATATRGLLGGTQNVVNYAIDARGTDPVLVERRTRAAIFAAHQSSVISSVQVSDEMLKRKPTRIGGR